MYKTQSVGRYNTKTIKQLMFSAYSHYTQRAHNVYTTSSQRPCNDAEATLYRRHVSAG